MSKVRLFLLFTGVFVSTAPNFIVWAQEESLVVISEIMWDGMEYVELYNYSPNDISLNGWKLTRQREGTEETVTITFSDTDAVASEGFFVVGKRAEAAADLDKIVATLVFHNDGELLRLYDETGNLIDSVNRFGSWFAGQNTEFGMAMERISSEANGSEASSWRTSTGNTGGRQGTPGRENSKVNVVSEVSEIDQANEASEANAANEASIIISEFLPNPAGSDTEAEFIELFNEEQHEVSLAGWQLDDGESGSKPYVFHDVTIPARSYVVLYRSQTKIALNNEGDVVRFINPQGEVTSNVEYGAVAEGRSLNTHDSEYVVSTTLTPGQSNVITAPVVTPSPDLEPEEDEPATVTNGTLSKHVFINEFLPNPVGPDTEAEFIELVNTGKERVILTGWTLDDEEGGSRPYTFTADDVLGPGEIKSFRRPITKLALNNDTDEVRLFDPQDALVSSFIYIENVPEGVSYNRTKTDEYVVSSTITEGKANSITAVDEANTAHVAGTSATQVPLVQLRSKELETVVTTTGTVIAPPGVLGERIMYISDSEAGVQVYNSRADFLVLSLGDMVQITGELSSVGGEARLKVVSTKDVTMLPGKGAIEPVEVNTGSITETLEGRLVRLRGTVTSSSGSTFYVDDGSGEIRIVIQSSTGISKPTTKKGMVVEVMGLVSETKSGYRILPRFQDDLRVGGEIAATSNVTFVDESNEGVVSVISAAGELNLMPDLFSEPHSQLGEVLGSESKPASPTARRNTLFLVLGGIVAVLIRSGIFSREPIGKKIKEYLVSGK